MLKIITFYTAIQVSWNESHVRPATYGDGMMEVNSRLFTLCMFHRSILSFASCTLFVFNFSPLSLSLAVTSHVFFLCLYANDYQVRGESL
jgi:hypothetical protein